jgi:hypothetical protein
MWRTLGTGIVLLLAAGCASGPLLPSFTAGPLEANPLYSHLSGPDGYCLVWENALKALNDEGFQIEEMNRLDGHIKSRPRVAPGYLLFLKPGSPELYERSLATLQSYRHHVLIKIHPANDRGFFIHVSVFKELEDLPRPVRATAGAVIFRPDNNVERQYDLIDPTVFESNWIPKGFDHGMEQNILQRLKKCI